MANLYLWTENTSFGTRSSASDASVGAAGSVTVIKYQTDGTNDLAGVAFKITIDSGTFPSVEDSGNTYQLSDCVNQAKQGKTFAHEEGQSSVETGVPENADIYGNTSAGNKWGLCSGNATSRIITLAGVTGLKSSDNGTNILAYLYGGHYSIESILSASDSNAKSYAAESWTFQVGNPNPNSAPTDITFTAVSNLTTDLTGSIGTLATTDSDSGDTHTYTLSAADGDETAPPFEIKNTNEVHVISGVPLTAATYSFKITTSDGNGGTYSEDFSVTISAAITNAAPTDITFSPVSDLKTDHTGSIGSLSTTDADSSDTHTYTITKTDGAAHDVFEIKNANEVHVKSSATIAAQEYTFKITTDDGKGGTYSENFSVTFSEASGGGGGDVTNTITFSSGYTWFSLSVIASSNTVSDVFSNPVVNTQILSQTANTKYSSNFFGSSWNNQSFSFDNKNMYISFIPSPSTYVLTVTGSTENEASISLVSGWNWISYPSSTSKAVTALITNQEANDQILSQTANTTYTSNFFGSSWNNPSFTFEPNKGYKYYTVNAKTLIISYS
jgi:hypothetical protein